MKASPGKKHKKSRSKRLTQKIKKQLRKFSLRQIKYRRNRIAGMSIYAAARAAGYAQSYARANASRILEKSVKESIIDELDMAGFTNKRQAEELTRIAFSSMTTEKCEVYEKDDDGNITVAEAARQVPDDYARLRALEQGGKLKKQISAPFEKTLFGQEYKRLIIVVENDSSAEHSVIGDQGGADPINRSTKLRVATTDK